MVKFKLVRFPKYKSENSGNCFIGSSFYRRTCVEGKKIDADYQIDSSAWAHQPKKQVKMGPR